MMMYSRNCLLHYLNFPDDGDPGSEDEGEPAIELNLDERDPIIETGEEEAQQLCVEVKQEETVADKPAAALPPSPAAPPPQPVIKKREHSPVKFDLKDDDDDNNDVKNREPLASLIPVEKRLKKPKSYDYVTKLNYLFRDARFFLIKSANEANVNLSKQKGVWSTPPQNEAKLNLAYEECRNVLLLFSVKESGKFAGFARLGGQSRRDLDPVNWILPPNISQKSLGGVFQIDWISNHELPFIKTTHLRNDWNDGKPVKIGRDGQVRSLSTFLLNRFDTLILSRNFPRGFAHFQMQMLLN
jgi:hypothetical protein